MIRAATLALTMLCLSAQAEGAIWIAGRDLSFNEEPDGPQELINPNPTVPEWSYGYRSTITGTALTLFGALDHFNNGGGHPNYDGWSRVGGLGPTVAVNAGNAPLVFNNGPGNLNPVSPLELVLHPRGDLSVGVVRWITPSAGSYSISAYWQDIDPFGGDGGSGHIVVNGTELFGQLWNNGGGASTSQNVTLAAGDKVDFVLGARSNFLFDSTRADATIDAISAVPEPSSLVLFAWGSMALLGYGWCRRKGADAAG